MHYFTVIITISSGPLFSAFSPNVITLCLFENSHHYWSEVLFYCIFICISLIISNAKCHLFVLFWEIFKSIAYFPASTSHFGWPGWHPRHTPSFTDIFTLSIGLKLISWYRTSSFPTHPSFSHYSPEIILFPKNKAISHIV